MKLKLFITVFFVFIFQLSFALTGEAYHGSDFIKNKPGARAKALGPAYLGFSDDASSLFYNPAGILLLPVSAMQFSLGYDNLENIQGGFATIVRMENYAFGIGAAGNYYEGIKTYDESGNEQDNLENYQGYATTGLAFYLTDFSQLGFSFKAGAQKIEERFTYVGAGSFGLIMRFYFLNFNFSVTDIGVSYQKEKDKIQFLDPDAGFALSYVKTNNDGEKMFGVALSFGRGLDLSEDDTTIGVASFIRLWSDSRDIEGFLEGSLRENDAFFLNLGMKNYHGISFSGGVTLIIFGLKMDYAIVFPTDSKEEFSHYVSLEIQF